MTFKSQAEYLLRKATNDPGAVFRDGQLEAIESVVRRKERILVVRRTGWGKSTVYFIATHFLRKNGEGPTLIVSPLISLIRNQIKAASKMGVKACSINSENRKDWDKVNNDLSKDKVDALLITPERLAGDYFVNETLLKFSKDIGLLVIDEVQCISDWGHDFRPDYRRISNILIRIPQNTPYICTTATASNRVVQDIQEFLGDLKLSRGSLMRNEITLQTMQLDTQQERLAWMAENIRPMKKSGIVYTLTKRDANKVASWLNQNNISAHSYYSGVKSEELKSEVEIRRQLEDLLMNDEIKVLVATTALGMGWDKSDLGFVIHFQSPRSTLHYYQQVGRAGRGIKMAYGILMSGEEDSIMHEHFRNTAFSECC